MVDVTRVFSAGLPLLLATVLVTACGDDDAGFDGGLADVVSPDDGSTGDGDGGPTTCDDGAFDDDADPSTPCVTWTACGPGEFVSEAGSATADQTCAGCESGTFSDTENAIECITWTTCAAGTFVAAEPSASADRSCEECEAGTITTGENQSMCVDADACEPGSVQTAPGTPTMQPTCEACVAGEYCAGADVPRIVCGDGDGTWDNDSDPSTACVERTTCAPGSFVTVNGDATNDRTCDPCAEGTFSDAPNTSICTAWATCDPGAFVTMLGTDTSDRVCMTCTEPTAGANYTTTACVPGGATIGTDTQLSSCTPPAPGSYVLAACTPGSSAVPGTDTQLGACGAPMLGFYTVTSCVPGSTVAAGVNSVIASCTSPGADEYSSALCVSGDSSTAGVDTTIAACSTAPAGSFTSSVCVSGNATTELGTDTVFTACDSPPAGEYTTTVCEPGSPSANGANTMFTTCSVAATTEYASVACDPGSFSALGTDTTFADCTDVAGCVSDETCTTSGDSSCTQCAAGLTLAAGPPDTCTGPARPSCAAWLAADPGAVSGVYSITPAATPRLVYCDMTTDGGGWTLVGSTRTETLRDESAPYYDDLTTLTPAGPHSGIWDGMRSAIPSTSDIRFSCEADPASTTMTVDLSFYNTDWYREITRGTDADSCFQESNGTGYDPPPARRNNVSGATLPAGDDWNAGYLEGEDSCDSPTDFTVDFDDRGMDSNQSDGTDWGEDDSSRKCGVSGISDGSWFIWVRESATCSNGSSSNCNVAGTTPGTAFVDPAPPTGWTQCAGFVNTSGNDVTSSFHDNCLNSTRLRVRVFTSDGALEEDVFVDPQPSWTAWPNFAYLEGSLTAPTRTNWGSTAFFTTTNGRDACGQFPAATGDTFGSGNGNRAIIVADDPGDGEYRVNCGGASLPDRRIAIYR